MKTFEYTIQDELGIHARPAGLLVKCVKASGSKVTIIKGEKTVDASKLMAVMGMGVKCQDTVRIDIDGEDEDSAYEAVKKFFDDNL